MKQRRVVITGLGIIAANGTGKNEFWDGMFREPSLYEESRLRFRLSLPQP